MDIVKTKQYYEQLTEQDICDCAYCRNYIQEIRSAYSELADYFDEFGVNIEKPFEVIPGESENGIMCYYGVQYVAMGSADDYVEASVGDVKVFITDSHPGTEINEDHFVIEVSPIYLKWRENPMPDELQRRIVSLIPSTSLKNQIKLTNFRLSDADLLSTAYHYATDYDTRIELLQMLEQHFTGELRDYTARLIQVQRQMLEAFSEPEETAAYELHIKETPDAYDEGYLCKSFHAALRLIPLFYKEYGGAENSLTRYRIVKRRILTEEDDFSEDELGELVLLAGMRIYSVNVWSFDFRAEDCSGQCLECNRPCAACHETIFPQFLRNGDAVKFYELSGAEAYGIAFVSDNLPCSEYYVIPLDSDAVRHHDFANIHDAHQHIPAPLAERIEADALPEEMREDYRACLQYILENWQDET